jgi:hypothetical protein
MGGFLFHYTSKVSWLSSNLTNFVDNNGFWMFKIFLNYLMSLIRFFQTTYYHRWQWGFVYYYLFSRHPSFPRNKYIMLLTKIGGGGHSLFNIVHENDFLKTKLEIILVPSSYFPLLSQFHYPSLLNDIQVWDLNIWTTKSVHDPKKNQLISLHIVPTHNNI